MKYIVAIVAILTIGMAGAASALSVEQPVHTYTITSVGVAHPTQTLVVQQAGLQSAASADATAILQ